ncbi:hypothetical protein N658DRAFT_419534 [Parathielavia hyrcaniae]|uniref:Putative transcription factor kapC n=1 Tax=Parathielavia hyrcaniae TaxID=113614 RepID=A0AAN6Q783_9PEZI|nr:hypothetical protein N658DRAFT_419534 [Parathielavia hyrcaniae]
MDSLAEFVDFPSPAGSMYYLYGDAEQYLSESQSPDNSTVSLSAPDGYTYDTTSAGDSSISSRYPSPGHEDGEEDCADSTEHAKSAAPKRKRENRYKNAPPAVLSRRRAQNRASQRAYRERKDQRIKDLEQMLGNAKQRNEGLTQAYATLHAEYVALKSSRLVDDDHHQHAGTTTTTTAYPSQQQQHYDMAAYAAGLAGSSSGLGDGRGLDLDLFVYSDALNAVAAYAL